MTERALASSRPAASALRRLGFLLPVLVFVMVAVGLGIEWGVYGVPETFVLSRDGTIAYKHIGPVSAQDLAETILPLVERLRQ
jgi:hypothetical protein